MNIPIISFRILLVVFLCSEAVYARMYQWTEPATGTTQLSGKPPTWYRSESGGPRVFVFDNGRLIDDTAIEVESDMRQRMRQQAFLLGEEDKQKASEKNAKSQELKQRFDKEKALQSDDVDLESLEEIPIDEVPLDDTDEALAETETTEQTLEELRNMIVEWEKAQTESAKKALE